MGFVGNEKTKTRNYLDRCVIDGNGDRNWRRRVLQGSDDPHKREKVKIFNEEIQRQMYQMNVAVERVIEEQRRR